MESIENFFTTIGIGLGPYGDIQRFLFGSLTTSALIYAIKPSIFFNSDGTTKQWFVFKNPSENIDPSHLTKVPWWVIPLIIGSIFGILI